MSTLVPDADAEIPEVSTMLAACVGVISWFGVVPPPLVPSCGCVCVCVCVCVPVYVCVSTIFAACVGVCIYMCVRVYLYVCISLPC